MTTKLKQTLKHLIFQRDITPAQLSRATKVPPQTINNWLSGSEPRSLEQLKKVADYFDVSLDYLAFGTSIKETKKEPLKEFEHEINAGTFEVVLRKVKK